MIDTVIFNWFVMTDSWNYIFINKDNLYALDLC